MSDTRRLSFRMKTISLLTIVSGIYGLSLASSAPNASISDYISAQKIRKLALERRLKEVDVTIQDAKMTGVSGDSMDIDGLKKTQERLQKKNMKKVMSGIDPVPSSKSTRIAALNLLALPDEIRSGRNGYGQLRQDVLAIYSNGRILKKLFYVAAIDMPIENMPGTKKCFSFKYGAMRHSMCGADEKSRNAWMNALTETWFCLNYRICGKLSDAEAALTLKEEEAKRKAEEEEATGIVDSEEDEDDADVYKLEVINNKGVLTKKGRVVDAATVADDRI